MEALWMILAIVAVLLAWLVAVYAVRSWGGGYGARSVVCPHKGVRATISTSARAGDGWSKEIRRDVLQCSLLPGQPVTCDKTCLSQL
jgi:hypothetical protein